MWCIMPITIPEAAGDPYRPSNGTEGELFKIQFCERCRLNTFDHDTGQGGCEIELHTMCFDVDDPAYPKEWKFDESGRPTCTAFESE